MCVNRLHVPALYEKQFRVMLKFSRGSLVDVDRCRIGLPTSCVAANGCLPVQCHTPDPLPVLSLASYR